MRKLLTMACALAAAHSAWGGEESGFPAPGAVLHAASSRADRMPDAREQRTSVQDAPNDGGVRFNHDEIVRLVELAKRAGAEEKEGSKCKWSSILSIMTRERYCIGSKDPRVVSLWWDDVRSRDNEGFGGQGCYCGHSIEIRVSVKTGAMTAEKGALNSINGIMNQRTEAAALTDDDVQSKLRKHRQFWLGGS